MKIIYWPANNHSDPSSSHFQYPAKVQKPLNRLTDFHLTTHLGRLLRWPCWSVAKYSGRERYNRGNVAGAVAAGGVGAGQGGRSVGQWGDGKGPATASKRWGRHWWRYCNSSGWPTPLRSGSSVAPAVPGGRWGEKGCVSRLTRLERCEYGTEYGKDRPGGWVTGANPQGQLTSIWHRWHRKKTLA